MIKTRVIAMTIVMGGLLAGVDARAQVGGAGGREPELTAQERAQVEAAEVEATWKRMLQSVRRYLADWKSHRVEAASSPSPSNTEKKQ